jgi:carbamoyltransferase
MYAVDAHPNIQERIPAILHVDYTCRIQTLTREQNEHYYNLIDAFYKQTNVPILFNTSFNLAGEPLVETPEDALKTFNDSEIKYLYFPEIQKLISK